MATTNILISSNVLASNTASVTFSSIPATYTDLVVKCSVRSIATGPSATLIVKFNADSTSNYSYTQLTGNSGGASSTRALSQTSGDLNDSISGNSATAATFSSTEIYIPKYTSTGVKPYVAFTVAENNSVTLNDAFIKTVANQYRGTSAISSIAFTSADSFASGSSFYLYGIKNS
jgi:hypothetical protein